MTEPRHPAPGSRAGSRAGDSGGPNPLDRPLPPGLTGRRPPPSTYVAPPPASRPSAATFRSPGTPAPRAEAPARPEPRAGRGSTASRHGGGRRFDEAFEPGTPRAAASPHGYAPPRESDPSRGSATPRAVDYPPSSGAGPTPAAAGAAAAARRAPTPHAATAGRRAGPAASTAIPFAAPPAWQVAGLRAEERQLAEERATAQQRGLPSWAALGVLLVITGIGGIIDAVGGAGIKGAFSIGLIVGSLVAIIVVRRSAMFPVVVAPPLVYFVASAVLLYVRSGGLSSRSAIIDAATSWLVYGFPSIAGATAVVLIVAGVRMVLRR